WRPATFPSISATCRRRCRRCAAARCARSRSPAPSDRPPRRTCRPSPKRACAIARSRNGTLIAPAGTPAAVIERLHDEIARIMREAEIRAKFADLGADAIGSTPQELAAFLKAEMVKWAEVVKTANIRIE